MIPSSHWQLYPVNTQSGVVSTGCCAQHGAALCVTHCVDCLCSTLLCHVNTVCALKCDTELFVLPVKLCALQGLLVLVLPLIVVLSQDCLCCLTKL